MEAFQNLGLITSIKPLLFESILVCSDQQIISFETTDDPDLSSRIPRSTYIGDYKVTTDWKEAPKVCYYCEKEGYVKKDCEDLKLSIELRRAQKEKRLQKNRTSSNTTSEFSSDNSYISNSAENTEKSNNLVTSENTSTSLANLNHPSLKLPEENYDQSNH